MKSETVNLGDIVSFIRGLTYSKKNEVKTDGIPVLRATNVDLSSNKIILDDLRLIDKSVKIKEDKFIKKGDLIICTASGSKSHLGKVALIEENLDMAFGGFMAAMRCNDVCYPRFLYYILISDSFKTHLARLSDGANINNLKFSQIEGFQFLLPPLLEQKNIVLKLDALFSNIDKAIELTKEKEEELISLKKALLLNNLTQKDV